jgi:NADH:flavin oxidoreductase / NADH oxidase family
MDAVAARKLFSPVQIGAMTLLHRVVMAPLTRFRSLQPGDIPGDLMLQYYGQRASEGGLILSEGTNISLRARGWYGAPGMYSDQQVAGWKKIVDAVHAKGGKMFSQLWHTGRSSHTDVTNGPAPVAPSVVPAYYGPETSAKVSTPNGWAISSPHGLSIPRKFLELSRTIARPPSGRKEQSSTASNCMAPMVICRINSYRTAATSAPTCMAAPLRTAPASFWK